MTNLLQFDPQGCYSPEPEEPGWIRLLDPDGVPDDIVDCALAAQLAVSERLGLPYMPRITFFETCAADHPRAQAMPRPSSLGFMVQGDPRDVFVRAGRPLPEIERTTVHEIRHAWQIINGLDATHSRVELEVDAHTFDRAWTEGKL